MNDEKRGRGHPFLPEHRRRKLALVARVREEEKRAVEASARERGVTVSAYIRSLLGLNKEG